MEKRLYEILYETEKHHWWYAVRRKIIHDLIGTYAPPQKPIKLLDIGCGTGELLRELSFLGKVSGIDNSPQAIAFCKERGLKNVFLAEGTNIPFRDDTFDIVLCLDVLEHIENDDAALKEIRRIAKPEGTIIIFVPTFRFLWGKSDELGHHLRRYRLKELRKKIGQNGLKVVRSSYFNFFLFFPILASRWLIRLFRIPIQSENETGKGLLNGILFGIFSLEARLLSRINFPFGVSGLVVSKKSD